MATLVKQTIDREGLEPAYAAADVAGDAFVNAGKEFLHIRNDGATNDCVVTIVTTATNDGLAVEDRVVTVPFGEERFIGPFPVATYGSTVNVTYDQVDTVSIAVLFI